jgi:hypothetical protein
VSEPFVRLSWQIFFGPSFACAMLAGASIGVTADENSAMNQPDLNSWQLFSGVVLDAKTAGNNNVVFETWASDLDTFKTNPQWPNLPGAKVLLPSALGMNKLGDQIQILAAPAPSNCRASWKSGKTPCIGEEVRRNHVTFDYIVNRKLYSQVGLASIFGNPISFPIQSIEVKADWIPVDELKSWNGTDPIEAAAMYDVNYLTERDGSSVAYALVGLHVVTKEVPNWTWATFEHWKNPARCDATGCSDDFGAVVSKVLPNAKPNQGYPVCTKTPALLDMFKSAGVGSLWQNYCLRGSQTDFTSTTGKPTILGNSVIEGLNGGGVPVNESSCMTCHATAAFNSKGKTLNVGIDDNKVGAPQQAWFRHNKNNYQQSDFVWGVSLCAIQASGKSSCVPN